MKKHTKRDNLISFIIGASLAIPVGLFAINNPTTEARELPTAPRVEINFNALETIEDTEIPTASTPYQESTKKESLGRFKVTAYCACEECCPGTSDGLTYTETRATEGRTIAVDPKVIPLGSKVELNGKTYIAEDIGGAVKGSHIDLYFNTHNEARQWGRQYKEVYLIKEN
jgi:3D (Asp-Asp-Asp) domain-containing protein